MAFNFGRVKSKIPAYVRYKGISASLRAEITNNAKLSKLCSIKEEAESAQINLHNKTMDDEEYESFDPQHTSDGFDWSYEVNVAEDNVAEGSTPNIAGIVFENKVQSRAANVSMKAYATKSPNNSDVNETTIINKIAIPRLEIESQSDDEFEDFDYVANTEVKASIYSDESSTEKEEDIQPEWEYTMPYETDAMRSRRLQAMFQDFHEKVKEIRDRKLLEEIKRNSVCENASQTHNCNECAGRALPEITTMLENINAKYQKVDELMKSKTPTTKPPRKDKTNETDNMNSKASVQEPFKSLTKKKRPPKKQYYMAVPQHRELLLCKPCLYDPSPLVDKEGNIFCPFNCGCCLCPWQEHLKIDEGVHGAEKLNAAEPEAATKTPMGISNCKSCSSTSISCHCCYQAERKHVELYGDSMWNIDRSLTRKFEGAPVLFYQVKCYDQQNIDQ